MYINLICFCFVLFFVVFLVGGNIHLGHNWGEGQYSFRTPFGGGQYSFRTQFGRGGQYSFRTQFILICNNKNIPLLIIAIKAEVIFVNYKSLKFLFFMNTINFLKIQYCSLVCFFWFNWHKISHLYFFRLINDCPSG